MNDIYQCPLCEGLLALRDAISAVRDDHYECPRCGEDIGKLSAIAEQQKSDIWDRPTM